MAKTTFTVTVPNWEKHNGSKKKNHRYILLETRFFEDSKITQLKQIDVLLFIKCLTIAGDLLSSCFEVHAGMMPKRWRINDKLLENCLKSLQEIQLLTYEKNESLIIQYNTIQKKTKEEKVIGAVAPTHPLDPFFQKRFDPKKLPKAAELWNANCGSLTPITMTTRNWNVRSDVLLDDYGEQELARVFTLVAGNSFLTGQNKRKWRATFAWVIHPDNFGKILAGDYDSETGVANMLDQLRKELEAS